MGSKTQTTSQNSTSGYTPNALGNLQEIYNRASSAASTPYTPYTGQLTAGLTDTQNNAVAGANSAAGIAQPYYQTAANYATTGAAPISASDIQRYTNPYTQSVVDATRRNFAEDNGQQQQQVVGNAALKGALGGDRVGVAQAELARQQKLAQDPVIANLQSQGYSQAVSNAQADRAAAAQGAGAFSNIGSGAQSAALQGVQGQLTAGGVQQQNNQANLDAQYKQYLQAMAYPYQQAQFLAGIGLPAAGAMGGTTTGTSTTTSPGPNTAAQIAGLGLQAASLFSDEKLKEDIKPIGKTFDHQTVYSYRYKGSPYTQIGLLAQEVERSEPDAVGESRGFKTVDYDRATEESAKKGKFAAGGAVSPFDFIADARGYVPAPTQISMGQSNQPAPMQMSSPKAPQDDLAGISKGLSGLKGAFAPSSTPDYGQDSNIMVGNYSMPQFGNSVDIGNYRMPTIGFANGGNVYADGGATFDDRFGAVYDQPDIKDDSPFRLAGPEAMDKWRKDVDHPNPAIVADSGSPPEPQSASPMRVALPKQITGPEEDSALPDSVMAFDRANSSPASIAPTQDATSSQSANSMGGFNPFNLSDKTRMALAAAGAGIMSSRSPFALSAIGEGSSAGLKTYGEIGRAEQEAADKKITQKQADARIQQEAKRIAQQAEQFTKTSGQAERRLKLAEDKTPEGYRATKDGLEPIPNGPADPEMIKKVAEAKRSNSTMGDDTAEFLAERVLAGDTRALIGLGRGAQGAENLQKIQGIVAAKAKERGLDASDILAKAAEQSGVMAGQRTFGTQTAKMAVNATEAQGAIELGRAASANVPRGNWVPVNKAVQAYQAGTSNPALAKFGAANLAIINTYARAISPSGVPTVNDKIHAEHLLSTATGPEAYNAILDQMNEEIKIAHGAPAKAKKELEDIRKGRTPEDTKSSGKYEETKEIGGKKYGRIGKDWFAL